MNSYDIVIIGGGLAGLTVARQLGGKGFSILVLEKKPSFNIRPIRCGEAFGLKSDWPAELVLNPSWVETELAAIMVETSLGTQYRLVRPDMGWAVSRTRMEEDMAEEVRRKGCEIRLNTYVTGTEYRGDSWYVKLGTPPHFQEIKARFVVGADGAESRTGVFLGIRKKWPWKTLCTTAQIHLPAAGFPHNTLHFYVGPRLIRQGYAWIFPGIGNVHNIGVGSIEQNQNRATMKEQLFHFLRKKNIPFSGEERLVYGSIPVDGYEKNPIGRQCLILGDCAGMAFPLSGGGILNTLHAALFAAQGIEKFFQGKPEAFKQYPRQFRNKFFWYFKRELWARKILFSCTDEEVEDLLIKTKKAMPKNYNATSEARSVIGLLLAAIPFTLKKLWRHAIQSAFVWLILLSGSLQAAPDSAQIADLQAALGLAQNQAYDSSFSIFNRYIAENPADPLGPVFKMSILGLKMMDLENNQWANEFEIGLKNAIVNIGKQMAIGGDSAWDLYAKGAALSTLASHRMHQKEYWKGVQTGFDAIDCLRLIPDKNPVTADGLLYLGLYDYVMGELKRKLRFVLFWKKSGGKEEGIRKLETCRSSSLFSRMAASQTLLGIYAREKKEEKALEIFRTILAQYPANRSARWTLANAYFTDSQWQKAQAIYSDLLPLLKNVAGMADWQTAECQYQLAFCAFQLGNPAESRRWCMAALGNLRWDDKRSGEIRRNILDLKKKLEEKS